MEENKDLEQESSSTPQPMTKADEIKQTWLSPDFTPTKVMTDKDLLSTSVMQMSDAEREDLLRSTGVYASTGQQVSTAIENALTGMNQLGDELMISFGNVSNYITGGAMGKELQDIAYDSMARRYEYMAMNEDAVGGIRSELAQLAGGATSFLQLALEGLATGGYLSLAHIGAQSFGEGTYNDMKAYADKHDGSLEGYKPQGVDLAINTANAIMQVATEEILGVGRVGFIKSAALRGGIKEGLGGFVQEAAQGALADLAEAMKGNEEYSVLLDNIDQYVRDGIIGGVLQGSLGAASYHHYHAKATNTLSGAIAKARGHETPTAEDQQQAEDIIGANERGYASAFVKEFKAAFDASTGEGQLQANIAKAINDAIKAKELDLGIDDETKRAQKVEQIATQETLNAMEQANEQGKSIAELGINNIVYKDGAIWVEGVAPEVGERAVEYARVLAERQTGLAEVQTKLDSTNREIAQLQKEIAEAKVQSKEALVEKLKARLAKQTKLAEKRKIQAEQLKSQTDKIEAQIAKQFSKESAETASAVKASEKIADVQEAPKPAEEPKPLAKVAEKTQKPKAKPKSVKAERVGKMKDADIERYDPNKKYNKYDVVKIKTQSGEHIGVWGGDRMWLFNDTNQAQQYIQNDKEITAMREQEAAESERRKKERIAKQEQALRDGDGWVDGEYIVQRLKDNDMWEGLSLREKGNLNAIGQVMFINGEVVNAFGNANSKKGTKVTQNTLNTIQKLRDKINEQKQEVSDEEEFLHQETLDNRKNGTTINTPGGENDTAKEARTKLKERIKSVIDTIRRNVHTGLDGNVWVQPSSGDSGVQQTSGVRRVNLAPKYQQQLNELGVSTPTFVVYENANESAQEFREAILAAKEALGEQAASVDAKDLEDYQDMKVLVLSEDKKTGFAITKDGDIVSLFSSSSERGRTIPMLLLAIQNGGTKLDCFDIYLPGLYSKMGFKAVARNNWVEKYKPDGWDKEYFKKYNNGEPDVVFMVYDENNFTEYAPGDGKLIKSGDVDADYGLGMQAQDEALADIAFQKAQGYKHMMVPGNQMLRQEETTSDTGLKQSKVEGTGSDKYRGGYDEKLKRIVLSDKSDLTTIQHEFAHYWLQNNFKWARSGLASPEWLHKWRDVEEALGIEPQDRFLSKQASEKFARAYERFIMEGKYNEDLKWAFDGFKEFYDETYEDLKNEYFDLSEELDPAIVDWFNRQRPTTEKALKEQAYKKVATVAMAQGAEIVDKVDDNTYTVSSMNKNGEIETEVFVSDNTTKDSKLVEYSGKKKERRMVKGLQEINKDINPDMYKAVNNAGTVENARNWVESDYNGAWQALNDGNTALIDRTALYQAFKSYAEDGHPEVAVDLAQIKLTKEMTELGQAMSILSERSEFDPMNIIDMAQKALGEPSVADTEEETADMHVEQEQNVLTQEQDKDLKNQTECKL